MTDNLVEQALEECVRRGKRLYFTTERDKEDLVTMLMGFGMNKEAIARIIDVVAFQDKTVVEFIGFQGEKLLTNDTFIKGVFTGHTFHLKNWEPIIGMMKEKKQS